MARTRYSDIFEGAGVRVRVTFRNPETLQPMDVTQPVTISVQGINGGAISTGTAIRKTGVVGTYEYTHAAGPPGRYTVRATSSGAEAAVVEDEYTVRESALREV